MARTAIPDLDYEYADDVPGGIYLKQTGKSPLLLIGDEANRAKATVDRMKQEGPQPVAGTGTGVISKIGTALNPWKAGEAVGEAVGPTVGAVSNPRKLGEYATAGGMPPEPPKAPPAPPQAPPEPPAYGTRAEPEPETPTAPRSPLSGQPTDSRGWPLVYRQGTPGRTTEQMRAQSQGGVEFNRAGRIEEGIPIPEQIRASFADAIGSRAMANEELRDLNIRKAESERELAQSEAAAATAAQMEAQRIQQLKEQQYTQDLQRRQDALAQYESASVDPGRIYSGDMGTLRAIGQAIAAGFGAYAAAITRTPNYALQIMNDAIDRDIRAQEVEINKKGRVADNALADLQRSGLELDQAKSALKSAMLRRAQSYGNQIKAAYAPEQVNAQHDAAMNAIMQQAAEQDLKFQLLSADKVTRTTGYQYPKAGTQGGYRRATIAELKAMAELQGKNLENEKARRELMGELGGKRKLSTAEQKLVEREAGIKTIRGDLAPYLDEDLPVPQTMSFWKRGSREALNWLGGAGTYEDWMWDEREQRGVETFLQARRRAMDMMSMMGEQGVIREYEQAIYDQAIMSAQNARSLDRTLERIQRETRNRRSALDVAGEPTDLSTVSAEQMGQ